MRLFRLTSSAIVLLMLVQAVAGCGGATSQPAAAPTSAPSQATAAPASTPAQPTAAPAAQTVEPARPTPTAEAARPAPTADAAQSSSSTSEGCPKTGGQLIVGLASEPSKLDPHRTAAENAVLPLLQACETLILKTPQGEYKPGLAQSWEVSKDGLSYTFHLRKGIKFQDGTPFDAEAVKYNLDRIIAPETASAEAIAHVGTYTSTEVIDDSTAVVHLSSPYAPLLTGLSTGWTCMVSPTAAKQWGVDNFQEHFVGTGPFKVTEWKRHESILLVKNPDYWGGPEFFKHHGQACLDSILFKFVGEASVRSGTLSTGELQVAQEVPAVEVERLKADPNLAIEVLPGAGTGVMLMFNMSKAPTDDLKVRQALNYGIDQKAVSDIIYQGVLAPNYGPLTPNTYCAWSGASSMYPYDQAKAKALLDEAGWKDTDGDGIREKDGKKLTLDFPVHGEFPLYSDPAPIVQSQLKEIGVDVSVRKLAAPAWIQAGVDGDLNIGIVDWRDADPDTNLRLTFHSANSSGFAWNHHHNQELDSLIEKGMTTLDMTERCSVYEQVQKIIMNDAMIKPLHVFSAVWGVRKEVKNLTFDTLGPSFFWAFDAYLDK